MKAKLMTREVLPFALALLALVLAAWAVDALLHFFDLVWVGRYLGIPGVLVIMGSFAYSLRKRKIIQSGQPLQLLHRHEWMAWSGSLMVLVHAGIHFNAWLAWLALIAMMVNVTSGLAGKFLLTRSRQRLANTKQQMQSAGVPEAEQTERLYWDSLTLDVVKKWRVIHIPIALAFAVLAVAHMVSIFLFWGWK